jgi:DNA-binding LytR/AlgR family response regulator
MQAFQFFKRQPVDLLFLDIRMPGFSGIELLKTLREPPRTILTTAFPDYALDGYDLDIVDYLLKPVTFERFFRAVERFRRQDDVKTAPGTPPYLDVRSGYRQIRISLADILYIESQKDHVRLRTLHGDIIARHRISELETSLVANDFLRVHRSFIISLKQVTAFGAGFVELGGVKIPVGESYKRRVADVLVRNS